MGALEGKVAIVTGSASGIGEAIARRFGAEGAGVVVNSVHSVDAGRAVAASLPDAVYVQARPRSSPTGTWPRPTPRCGGGSSTST
jgi:ketoreductase RED2